VQLCQIPENFAALTLEGKALAIHACHEQDVAAFAACAARQRELSSWVSARVRDSAGEKKPGN
jgi:hypothetical protein